jgi:hypothetical protein
MLHEMSAISFIPIYHKKEVKYVPPKTHTQLEQQNVMLFRNRIFAGIIS